MVKKSGIEGLEAIFSYDTVIIPKDPETPQRIEKIRQLNNKAFGTLLSDGRLQISLVEALFLFEKGLVIKDGKGKLLSFEEFVRKASRIDKQFWTRYVVFRDLRNRGYIVKTALKFGADFRVYDRGVKPGQDHAKWVVFPVHESGMLTWHDFAAKNRVAHSTKKRLMIAVVDDEGDITYYEVRWLRP